MDKYKKKKKKKNPKNRKKNQKNQKNQKQTQINQTKWYLVKKFLREDAPNMPLLKVVYIAGYDPVLYFLDEKEEVIEKIELSSLSRVAIISILQDHGIDFKKE